MGVKKLQYPWIKLVCKLSYLDDLNRNLLYRFTKYWNVTKCRYTIQGM